MKRAMTASSHSRFPQLPPSLKAERKGDIAILTLARAEKRIKTGVSGATFASSS